MNSEVSSSNQTTKDLQSLESITKDSWCGLNLPNKLNNGDNLTPRDEISRTTTHSGIKFSFTNDNSLLLNNNKITVSSANLCLSQTHLQLEGTRHDRITRQSSIESSLSPIREDEDISLTSTQHLRTGFFRSIKRQYPSLGFDGLTVQKDADKNENVDENINRTEDNAENNDEKSDEEEPFMSSMARKRLRELRKVDPTMVDVATGLQWIRLELHEMREQDKSLFLQLIKLHTTIKELRSELSGSDHDSDGSYDDIHDAATIWWPRSNSGSMLPDFSSSDGAQLMRNARSHAKLRRGVSLNYHSPSRIHYASEKI